MRCRVHVLPFGCIKGNVNLVDVSARGTALSTSAGRTCCATVGSGDELERPVGKPSPMPSTSTLSVTISSLWSLMATRSPIGVPTS